VSQNRHSNTTSFFGSKLDLGFLDSGSEGFMYIDIIIQTPIIKYTNTAIDIKVIVTGKDTASIKYGQRNTPNVTSSIIIKINVTTT
jgi:hypothetical protein